MEDPCSSMCKNKWYFCTLLSQMVLWSIPERISEAHICLIQSACDMSAPGSSLRVHDHGKLRMHRFRLSRKAETCKYDTSKNGPWLASGFVQDQNGSSIIYMQLINIGSSSTVSVFHGQWIGTDPWRNMISRRIMSLILAQGMCVKVRLKLAEREKKKNDTTRLLDRLKASVICNR